MNKSAKLLEHWAYPTVYTELVEEKSIEYNVPLSVIYAVIAFIFKDQGNLFVYGKHRFYRMLSLMVSEENESYTETEDYKREFALSALIYCITIPAYITFALFANGFYAALLQALEWSMIRAVAIIGVVIVPPIFKQVKERKQKRIQYEADRKEQERRESMGKWK